MRPDVGLATISSRLAGMRSMSTPPAAASAPASATAFADALSGQVQAQTAAAEAAYAQAGFAQAGLAQTGVTPGAYGQPAFAPTGAAGTGMALLGSGTSLTGGGVIAPQMPGTAAVQMPGTAAVAHACPECQPALGPSAGVSAANVALSGAGAPTGTRSGPPAELQAYGNGRIPAAALQPLGVGDHALWAPAARGFTDMAAAAARDGVHIGVSSSYRSYEQQQVMVDRYGLYSQGGRAAAPESSNHGWGVSIDLQLDDQAQQWMRANGATYGFVEDVPREPWHWTFTAAGY